jgi:hypothetical protein
MTHKKNPLHTMPWQEILKLYFSKESPENEESALGKYRAALKTFRDISKEAGYKVIETPYGNPEHDAIVERRVGNFAYGEKRQLVIPSTKSLLVMRTNVEAYWKGFYAEVFGNMDIHILGKAGLVAKVKSAIEEAGSRVTEKDVSSARKSMNTYYYENVKYVLGDCEHDYALELVPAIIEWTAKGESRR